METVTVSSKGQIVIPKSLREAFDIVPGMQFVVTADGDEIRLRPVTAYARTTVEDGLGLLKRGGRKRLSDDETRVSIMAMLAKRDAATRRK